MPSPIQTKFRDVPYQDVKKCVPTSQLMPLYWLKLRGAPVPIIPTPAKVQKGGMFACNDPLFRIPTAWSKQHGPHKDGVQRYVCAHMVEYGGEKSK